jgi:hypothetical protein
MRAGIMGTEIDIPGGKWPLILPVITFTPYLRKLATGQSVPA